MFRYYQGRKAAAHYSEMRASMDLRLQKSSSSSDSIVDNAWFWVFIGIVAVAAIALSVFGASRIVQAAKSGFSVITSSGFHGEW